MIQLCVGEQWILGRLLMGKNAVTQLNIFQTSHAQMAFDWLQLSLLKSMFKGSRRPLTRVHTKLIEISALYVSVMILR